MGYFARNWSELKSQAKSWLAQGAKDAHNNIVPAFPAYSHGVDQPGTPLNMVEEKPGFEASLASQKPPAAAQETAADKGMEL